jgi:hypothetical protein
MFLSGLLASLPLKMGRPLGGIEGTCLLFALKSQGAHCWSLSWVSWSFAFGLFYLFHFGSLSAERLSGGEVGRDMKGGDLIWSLTVDLLQSRMRVWFYLGILVWFLVRTPLKASRIADQSLQNFFKELSCRKIVEVLV